MMKSKCYNDVKEWDEKNGIIWLIALEYTIPL